MPELLIHGLAPWRLSSLILYEDGPWAVFWRIRRWAGTDRPGEQGSLATLFSCVWCMSVWVAAVLYLVRRQSWILQPLAASAVAIIISHQIRRDET